MAASHLLFGLASFCGIAHLAIRVACHDRYYDLEIRGVMKQVGLLTTASLGVTFAAAGCGVIVADAIAA